MYTIVIVDDEDIIRRGIAATITNQGAGEFRVAGVAPNGIEGLELIRRLNPDIVLSDIKMPKMDGLEMIKQAKALGLSGKTVFLTGFDELAYVKIAMDLKAEKYLLKPLSPSALMSTLQTIAEQIAAERMLKRQIQENMPAMKQAFLHKLLKNAPTEPDERIRNDMRFYDIPFVAGSFLVLIFKMDDYNNKQYLAAIMESELCKFAIYNISAELLAQAYSIAACYSNDDEFTIIVNSEAGTEEEMNRVHNIGCDICEKVEQLLKTTVTIGVGGFQQGFGGISKSCHEASEAIQFRHVLGKNRIITIQDIQLLGRSEHAELELGGFAERLVLHIKLDEREAAMQDLRRVQSQLLQSKGISLDKVRIFAVEMIVTMIKEVSNWNFDQAKNIHHRLHETSEKIYVLPTIADIFDLLSGFLDEMLELFSHDRGTPQQWIVEQATRFIEENYGNENLSLRDVARKVHISSSYLSTIFKKEINESFTDYLTRFRMEKAKQMLRNESWKAYEVAERVGYSNPQYFSLCFKKYTGYSPLQYKNN